MEGLFEGTHNGAPQIESDRFTKEIVTTYGGDGASIDECIGRAVDAVWPVVKDHSEPPTIAARQNVNNALIAPSLDEKDDYEWFQAYRKHQRNAVVDILSGLYVDDSDVVTLSAPTGAGKSLILYAAMATIANEFTRKSFFTTPLNALIDQVDDDDFIADQIITLKGKNNYNCVHRADLGTSVDNAICQRDSEFECQYKEMSPKDGGCPYYGRRYEALRHSQVVTNLSYLMANSMIPDTIDSKFDLREIMTIDECQSIEDFALQFVTVTVSERAVPIVYEEIDAPPHTENAEQLAEWVRNEVLPPVRSQLRIFEGMGELTEQQSNDEEKLQQFERKCQNLISDVKQNHWVASTERDDSWSVEFKPIHIGRFLESYLWSQSHKVILSSATIPKSNFLSEIGLSDRRVTHVEIESNFDVDRRPVYTDQTVGKMTMNQRDRTIPKMATKIASIADHHSNERGFVHCHSYSIAARIYENLPSDVQQRTRVQRSEDREQSLDEWLDTPFDETGYTENEGGQIFLSVAMDEGISLDDWRARWQVVAKIAYPYMGPDAKRVNYRMNELNDWGWYSSKAIVNLQQAVGRGMRSKDDYCQTYILDSSVESLLEKNKWQFEDWWLNAVDVTPSNDIPDRF
jgi:Rad3-related DNA helicase